MHLTAIRIQVKECGLSICLEYSVIFRIRIQLHSYLIELIEVRFLKWCSDATAFLQFSARIRLQCQLQGLEDPQILYLYISWSSATQATAMVSYTFGHIIYILHNLKFLFLIVLLMMIWFALSRVVISVLPALGEWADSLCILLASCSSIPWLT